MEEKLSTDINLREIARHFTRGDFAFKNDLDIVLKEIVSHLTKFKGYRKINLASQIIAHATETNEHYRNIISEAGAIPTLVSLLNTTANSKPKNPSDIMNIRLNVTKALFYLGGDCTNQEQIALHGAIPLLLTIYQTHEEEEIGRFALGALKKLYKNNQCKGMISRAGMEKSLKFRRMSTPRIVSIMGNIPFPSAKKKKIKSNINPPIVEQSTERKVISGRHTRSAHFFDRPEIDPRQSNGRYMIRSHPDESETSHKFRNSDGSLLKQRRMPERSLSDSRLEKKSVLINTSPTKSVKNLRTVETISNKTKRFSFQNNSSPLGFLQYTSGSPRPKGSPKRSFDKSSPKTSFDKSSPKTSSTKSSPKTSFEIHSPNRKSPSIRLKKRPRSLSDSGKRFLDSVDSNTIRIKCIWDDDKRFVWVDKDVIVEELIVAIEKKYDTQFTIEQMKFRDPWVKNDLITISTRQDIHMCFKNPPVEIFIMTNQTPPSTPHTRQSGSVTRFPKYSPVNHSSINPHKYPISQSNELDTEHKQEVLRRRRRIVPKQDTGLHRKYSLIKSSDLVIPQDIDPLGQGFFGEVRFGYWRGSSVACKKVYEKSFRNKSDQELFFREVNILSGLRHPNIVLFLGICIDGKDKIIVTEYMEDGSLNDYLRKPGIKLDSATVLKVATDIALGMNHLHLEDVLHRDLTSRNILLSTGMAKVGDFGLSKKKLEDSVSFTMGSLAWMAPEVLVNPKKFTKKSDVYSYGMVIWELFSGGKNPCPSDLTHLALANKVINEAWRPSLSRTCPAEWAAFIEQCWAQNPGKRPEFSSIVEILKGWTNKPPEIKEGSFSDFDDSTLSEVDDQTETETEISSLTNNSENTENTEYDDNIN